MTENEAKAIRWIRNIKDDTVIVKEEIFDNKAMCCNILPRTIRKEININAEIIIKAISELDKYREIGTVEECREARERQKPKKPRFYAHNYYCGNCGNLVGNSEFNWKRFMYCDRCGNAVDWSE